MRLCLCTHVRPWAPFLFGSWFHRKLLGWGRECQGSPLLPTHLLSTAAHIGLGAGDSTLLLEPRPVQHSNSHPPQPPYRWGGRRQAGGQAVEKEKVGVELGHPPVTLGSSPLVLAPGQLEATAVGREGCRSW